MDVVLKVVFAADTSLTLMNNVKANSDITAKDNFLLIIPPPCPKDSKDFFENLSGPNKYHIMIPYKLCYLIFQKRTSLSFFKKLRSYYKELK